MKYATAVFTLVLIVLAGFTGMFAANVVNRNSDPSITTERRYQTAITKINERFWLKELDCQP